MNLKGFQNEFDTYFVTYLEGKLSEVRNLFPDESTFDVLTYLRQYTQKGKRFRPYMVYLGYKLYTGENDERIIKIGAIHELIHIFALIHDDICDQGLMRRHVPTYHKHLENKYENAHVGISQSIILGDLVYTRAVEEMMVLLQNNLKAQKVVLDMLQKVVCGQLVDIHFSHEKVKRSLAEIAKKDDLKSGQYTFENPLLLGAMLGGANESELAKFREIGKSMGIAFQMRDDLLDRLPNKEGKTKFSDIQEGNQTIVFSTLIDAISEKDKLFEMKGKKLESEDIDRIKKIFKEHGIQEKVIGSIKEYLDDSAQKIDQLDIDAIFKKELNNMIILLRTVA